MKVLITGGAGFIGSHLADRLLASGMAVRALDVLDPQVHPDGAWPAYLDSRVERVRGDVQDREIVTNAIDGVDCLVHLAAKVGVGQSQYEIASYTASNVQGTAILLDVLANARHTVRKIVTASSMSVYGEGRYLRSSDQSVVDDATRQTADLERGVFDPLDASSGEPLRPIPTPESKPFRCESIYALNKRDQEEYVQVFGRTYGIPTVACRFFNTYGTRQSLSNPYTGAAAIFFSRALQHRPPLVYEDGQQLRDFIEVTDLVRGVEMMMLDGRADGQTFNLASGTATSVIELARQICDIAGTGQEPEISGSFRKGDIRHCIADLTAAASLGFSPQLDLAEGLSRLVAWAGAEPIVDRVDAAQSELRRRGLAV